MKRTLFALLMSATVAHLQAQNWVNGGNTLTANGTLGTNSNHSLLFETNATERGRITNGGNWAIGSTGTSSKFTVNSASAVSPFRAQINGTTKFVVNGNGGVSIGSSTAGPSNGLYVAGNVGIGTATPAYKLHVSGNGYITGKLGINTGPSYPLHIHNQDYNIGLRVYNAPIPNNPGFNRIGISSNSYISLGYGIGVEAIGGRYGVQATGSWFGTFSGGGEVGVYAESIGVQDSHYGVIGTAYNEDFENPGGKFYGVFGNAFGGTFNAAGYFDGAVWAASYHTISDRKFKEGIAPLEKTLKQLMRLNPSTYQYKTDERKSMHLPTGLQFGLVADEVKEVFPHLVHQAVHPGNDKKESNEKVFAPEIKYEGINYQGFIPVLIASVQELKRENDKQQEIITQQQRQITDLQAMVNKLARNNTNSTSQSAFLSAPSPNPAKGTTAFSYTLPAGSNRAQLLFTDAMGKRMKTIQLYKSGVVQVDFSSFASGLYHYSLVVDNDAVETRKLEVVR